jgi:hypothetical protein
MTSDDSLAIDAAVARIRRELRPEDRFDMRQDLHLSLLKRKTRPRDVKKWAHTAALAWLVDFLRSKDREQRMLASLPNPAGYRVGKNWAPDWYPPHADAQQNAPFACRGARVMHVKPGGRPYSDVEKIVVEIVDAKRKSDRDAK